MADPKSETVHLRRELRRVWDLVEILLDLTAPSLGTARKALLALAGEISALREGNAGLRERNRELGQRVRIHESWNHAPSEATGYVMDRKRFRREAERHRAAQKGEDRAGPRPEWARGTGRAPPAFPTTTGPGRTGRRLRRGCARSAAAQISFRSGPYRSWSGS